MDEMFSQLELKSLTKQHDQQKKENKKNLKFIDSPRIFLKCSLKVLKIFIFFTIFSFGCTSVNKAPPKKLNKKYQNLSIEEKKWMNEFSNKFFSKNPIIYTIFGSKPLSEIPMNVATYEQWLDETKSYLDNLPKREREKKLEDLKSYCNENQLGAFWKSWTSWIKKHPSSTFLFLKQATIYDNLFSIYMLNVTEAIWIIEQNYDLFSKELEMNFEPIKVVSDFGNPTSLFWQKVLSNHRLAGILHGYGRRNAYFFSVEMDKKWKFPSQLLGKSKIGKIKLPYFRSYTLSPQIDPIMVKFEKEQKEITDYLMGKDLLEEIFNRLYPNES